MKKIINSIVVTASFIAASLAIYRSFYPIPLDTQRHEIIVGSWNTSYSYYGSGVTFGLKGVTTYFSNGKYNFHGLTSVSSGEGKETFSLISSTDAAGTWDIYDKEIIISQNDIKSEPLKLVMNGEDLDPKYVERVTQQKLPRIGSEMANGKSQAYKILSYNPTAIELEVINTVGDNFNTTLTRK